MALLEPDDASAWHEAGHVVAAWCLGLPVAWVNAKGGVTMLDPSVLNAMRTTDGYEVVDTLLFTYALAADAVDARRGRSRHQGHYREAVRRLGQPRATELVGEAESLVDDHWEATEAVARAILGSSTQTLDAMELGELEKTLRSGGLL